MDERLLPYRADSPLMHAGVKGMKWGSRKAKNQAIRDARIKREELLARNSEVITRLNRESAANPKSSATKKAIKDYDNLNKEINKKSDSLKIADSYTSGEKVAAGVLAGAAALVLVSAIQRNL